MFYTSDYTNFDFYDTLTLSEVRQQKFDWLDDSLKQKYLFDVLSNKVKFKVTNDWLKNDIEAFVIAQYRETFFKPTIIKVFGNNFSAMVLVNLDRNNRPLLGASFYAFNPNQLFFKSDSLLITQPKFEFDMSADGRKIYYKKIVGSITSDSLGEHYFIDTAFYYMDVNASGGIIRYRRRLSHSNLKFNLSDFKSF